MFEDFGVRFNMVDVVFWFNVYEGWFDMFIDFFLFIIMIVGVW